LLSLPPSPKASKNKQQKNKERKEKKKKSFSTEQTHPWLHSAKVLVLSLSDLVSKNLHPDLSSAFVSTRDFLHLILILSSAKKIILQQAKILYHGI
jgi:hypothetical protein